MVIGVDLGNKSRNAIVVFDGKNVLEWCSLNHSDSSSTWEHRKKICKQIKEYIKKYKMTKKDYLVFEQIFFSPGLSRMVNVTSMSFLQATLINEFSNKISIAEVHVQSWKSKVLGSRKATKEDAVSYVAKNFPNVDLTLMVEHKRKGVEIIQNHDLADAVCIAQYGYIVGFDVVNEHLVNYK